MRVLVVDDEPDVRVAVRRALALDGHSVELAADGEEALRMLQAGPPDLVVLDVNMPGVDGLEVCRRIRAAGDLVPVLMLTARDEISDRVAGLEAGADDYLSKPFAVEELLARVKALLRRAAAANAAAGAGAAANAAAATGQLAEPEVLRYADLVVDLGTWTARRGERALQLTRTEFSILELLTRNAPRVLARDVIHERVWGYDFGATSNTLEVHVGYLRRKLEAGGEPRIVHTVRGVGYALREGG
jgi:two-component system response regulator MprA